jgi:hypothetical protein
MLRNAVKYPDFIRASTLFCQLNKKNDTEYAKGVGLFKA